MLYEIAHVIRDRFGFLWEAVEVLNGWMFYCRYFGKLKTVDDVLSNLSEEYEIRQTRPEDVVALTRFFREQPQEAFKFFHPHEFDEKSIDKVVRNRAFQTFVIIDKANEDSTSNLLIHSNISISQRIVGYFFLRSFVNGKCFRGRMADYRTRGRGIGKLMAKALEAVAVHEGLRMFASISPENYASLNSAKAVSDVKIIKTLENGYYYIEVTPMRTLNQNRGG